MIKMFGLIVYSDKNFHICRLRKFTPFVVEASLN